jgi:hypothetical protein
MPVAYEMAADMGTAVADMLEGRTYFGAAAFKDVDPTE